jgi:uridine phosphorylase
MSIDNPYPILEYDPEPEGILEPARLIKAMDVPEHCVVCFFQDVINELVGSGQARQVAKSVSEMGDHPVYELEVSGRRLALFHPGVGAPLAGALLDEAIARGCRKFIACGSCGVLDREIAVGRLIVPTSAVRDEGTSYHYLPPAREVSASPEGVAAIEAVLRRYNVDYFLAKTWTTDGLYRETKGKTARRKAEGCLAVEMEAAAFFAVAQVRKATFAQILYSGDAVVPEGWDGRDYVRRRSVRQQLFWLAAEACLDL